MNSSIALFLIQDGFANGLLYSLLALSILLVFLVTRIFWIPAGEFVVFGALTMGVLHKGNVNGVLGLVITLSLLVFLMGVFDFIKTKNSRNFYKNSLYCLLYSLGAFVFGYYFLPHFKSIWVYAVYTVYLIAPLAPLLYLIVFKPILKKSVLMKLIVAVALHMVLVGLGLYIFGAEGARVPALISGREKIFSLSVSYQFLLILSFSLLLMVFLWFFFEKTLWGKSLKATALNQLGARLVAIHTEKVGLLAFALAGFIGAMTGVLISSTTTVYYDSGFLIALKGFIGVVAAGMTSFPIAVLSSIFIGIVDAFAAFYTSTLRDIIVFSVLIPILFVRSVTHKEFDEE